MIVAGLLVVHALNYLYFFVDDEAIPYVFAQNLLDGKGLRYNSFEGRVEGYSDFLHVLAISAILGSVRAAHLDKLTVFTINSAWSLLCGAAVVYLTFGLLNGIPRIRAPGVLAGTAFVVLSGPLAVWSCSSLESATFACFVTLLTVWTIGQPRHNVRPWSVAACAALVLLTRVDGVVYFTVVIGTTLLVTSPERRRSLLLRVVVPAVLMLGLYQLWRVAYFGELLPGPVVAKTLYKLHLHPHLLVKRPAGNYAAQFFAVYGTLPFLAICAAGLVWSRSRTVLASGLSAALLTGYLALVGDWMFGFRFFLPLLPLLAVLIASGVSAIAAASTKRSIGWVAAAVAVAWFGLSAHAFFDRFCASEHTESWLLHPSFDPAKRFRRYYSLVEQARSVIHAGDRTAFNQAGFVPFVLDLDNIDDLGLCSRFFAHLPTTDVYMTEVGRYEPPTDKPVHRAGEAYLLYREPQFVIVPEDLLRKANADEIPPSLYGGYYRFGFIDAARRNVLYERTAQSVAPFKTDPRRFAENLAHVTHIIRASVNGRPVPLGDVPRVFPWLRDQAQRVTVAGQFLAALAFADHDEAVYEFYVDRLESVDEVSVTGALLDTSGAVVFSETTTVSGSRPHRVHIVLPEPVRANRLRLQAVTRHGERARLTIGDVRVQGQTRALAEYVRRTLRFPAS